MICFHSHAAPALEVDDFQNAIRQASQSVSSGLIENITANIDLMRLDAPEKE